MVIENFLWDLQCYVDTNTRSKTDKVFLVSIYLSGYAKTWWRLRVEDTSRALIESWAT